MIRILFIFFIALCLHESAGAQTEPDSSTVPPQDSVQQVVKETPPPKKLPERKIVKADTVPVVKDSPVTTMDSLPAIQTGDSVSRMPEKYSNWEINIAEPIANQLLSHHPYFGFGSKPVIINSGLKIFKGKEDMFFTLIALVMTLSLLRLAFPKYFNDLIRLFFRTTLKQKQVREQLIQTPFPSLLLNIFFAVSGGLYLDIVLHHFKITPVESFWLLFLYCCLGLALIYSVKFVGLKIFGWLFNIKPVADTYIFVVFIINKVLGIFLLPFIVLLTFMQGGAYTVAMVLSWCGIGVLLIYRFLLTYAGIRNQVRFNPFHFFLYLCAFEIAPLLLIYKALLFFFR